MAARTQTSRRVQACLFGPCDGFILANQITQIAHMVTQTGRMVEQLQSLAGMLDVTTELVSSNDIGMGNIGRLPDVTDAGWPIGRHGIGLSTSSRDKRAEHQRRTAAPVRRESTRISARKLSAEAITCPVSETTTRRRPPLNRVVGRRLDGAFIEWRTSALCNSII